MIRPKNYTEDLFFSIIKNCETLVQQTRRKSQEVLELKTVKSKKIFHFNPSIQIDGSWMIGLINLEVYNSIFNINSTNKKLEFYTRYLDDDFSYNELEDELEEVLNISSRYYTISSTT